MVTGFIQTHTWNCYCFYNVSVSLLCTISTFQCGDVWFLPFAYLHAHTTPFFFLCGPSGCLFLMETPLTSALQPPFQSFLHFIFLLSPLLLCLDPVPDEEYWHSSPLAKAGPPSTHYLSLPSSYWHLIPVSPVSARVCTVHKICPGVISSPTQQNNERQWHDRLDIDEIAAVTICMARLGPGFASEMGKRGGR